VSAQPARHLALVDQNTGEVVDSRELAELQAKLEKAQADLKNAEKDLRVKRATITQLQADKVAERLEHPQRDLILGICKYWHQVCRPEDYNGRHRIVSSSPDRFDAVAALVEMERIVRDESAKGKRRREWVYEREHFAAAINGAAFDPFETVHKNGKVERHNDLSQICKDVTRFERAIAKCPYEVVPILPARVPPGALDVTARNAHTPVQVPSHRPTSTGHQEGSYGSSCVGATCGRVPVHVEASGLVLHRRVEAGDMGEPAP
jgi:hypothetical protein